MTSERDLAAGNATVTASGIARLANVGRAAVSNWRRRYADFPAPVAGTPTSPLFDAHEVERWLSRQGKLHHAGVEHWAWRHIESYQPAAQIGDALGISGAYLLVCSDRPAPRGKALLTPRQLITRLRALDRDLADLVDDVLPKQWTPQLIAVLRAVEQLSQSQEPEPAFEYLHSQYLTSAHSMSGLAGTPDSVAEVMLTLTGSGERTFDFTSGTGSILRTAADRAFHSKTPTHCYAQEIKQQYALITLLRLWFVYRRAQLAGHPAAPPTVRIGDSLLADAFPDLRADVIVANFPFGIHDWGHDRLAYDPRWAYGLPPRTEPELAWVQHALAHLAPGGAAAVLMPPAAAARPAGRRIRAELVRRGALQAVIALPAGLMPPTSLGLHIWVLTQPNPQHPPTGRLLFLDAAGLQTSALPNVVRATWHAYLSGQDNEKPDVHRTVPAIDVLDEQVDLTPRRYLPRAGRLTADPAQTIARIDEFQHLAEQVRRSLPPVQKAETAPLSTAPRVSLADLVRAGSVSVQRTASRTRTSNATDRPVIDAATQAAIGSPSSRIQINDILIPVAGREILASVAGSEQVGAELEPNMQLIRINPAQFDPWFVAGILSGSENLRLAGRASGSNGSVRIDIRRLTIPVLPLDQQRAYGQAFRQLAEFGAKLDEIAAAGAALAGEIRGGLTSGTLVMPLSPDMDEGFAVQGSAEA
jgi:hypothetical protein